MEGLGPGDKDTITAINTSKAEPKGPGGVELQVQDHGAGQGGLGQLLAGQQDWRNRFSPFATYKEEESTGAGGNFSQGTFMKMVWKLTVMAVVSMMTMMSMILWMWVGGPTWCCWATARVWPRVAGQELALLWWAWGPGPAGCCRGEATGPGENGPVLSREFSLLCTEGDLLPTVGGVKKLEGRLRIFMGMESGRLAPALLRPIWKSSSSWMSESSRWWMVICGFSSFTGGAAILPGLTSSRRDLTGDAALPRAGGGAHLRSSPPHPASLPAPHSLHLTPSLTAPCGRVFGSSWRPAEPRQQPCWAGEWPGVAARHAGEPPRGG